MKKLFLLLSLLSVPCVAQPKVSPPQVVVSPEAKTLLDEVTATYRAAQGIRLSVLETQGDRDTHRVVSFQKPNLLRVETRSPEGTSRLISDGVASYLINGTTYKRDALPQDTQKLWEGALDNGTGFLISGMLEGHSPLVALQESLKTAPFKNPRMSVIVPPPAVVQGVPLRGVKINLTTSSSAQEAPSLVSDIYLWFDAAGLLRRISGHDAAGKNDFIATEQISEQELNPTFAPDTFKFDATGLTVAPPPPSKPQFDPRLKAGAAPFAFSAKDVKGQPISLDKYKGKVVLLDFWATWCGPCVASLPELKSAYDKYHIKGFEVVGISLDHNQKALTSFIQTKKMAWPQVFDGKGWKSRVPVLYGVQSIPFLLVIGRDGKIAAVNPRGNIDGAVRVAMAAK